MYIMIKKTLKERIKEPKKRNYLTLLDILDILLTNQKKGQTLWVNVKSMQWDCAEEQSDDIIKSYVNGEMIQ